MKSRSIFIALAIVLCSSIRAQSPSANLEKYWKFKERLNNYNVVGDCQGCSLPSGARSNYAPFLEWHDQTGEQGYYIATLACEYKLKMDNGLPLTDISRELFYAIEALNRLDYYADYWWDYYYNSNTSSPAGNLNGFLIRDDVPADFFDRMYNGNLIENQLNKSLFPPQDYYRALTSANNANGISSGFTRGPQVAQCNGHTLGPEEMSQDHFISILGGLAVVVKLIPSTDTYGNTNFMDNQPYFAQEAKNIANRVITLVENGDWLYKNPITQNPVQGVTWNECHPGDNDAGGGSFRALSYGYALCLSKIMNNFNDIPSLSYFANRFGSQGWVATSSTTFSVLQNSPPSWPLNPNEDFKVLMLAAISNCWGSATQTTLGERFDSEYQNGAEVHVAQALLINAILYGSQPSVPNSTWECLLNSAPCDDFNSYNHNFEWSHGHGRMLYGPNTPQYYYSAQLSAHPYLYFFNMYNVYNPGYLGSAYQVIAPDQLLNNRLDLPFTSGYNEHDEKNFFAAQKIMTQGTYTISNDMNGGQAYASPLDQARVTFAAGQSITLTNGFTVTAGANFLGYIDPSLGQISCQGVNQSAVCTNCKPSGNETNPGNVSDGTDGLIITPIGNDQMFIAYDHHLFKVEITYAQGSTMFGLNETDDCSNFPCRSGCNGDSRYNIIGYHNFDLGSNITAVVFTGTSTFVSLTGPTQNHKGRIIKFSGSGGTGWDIIGLDENPDGTVTPHSQTYFEGVQYLFGKEISRMDYIQNNLFITMPNRLMKITSPLVLSSNSVNMFDVTVDNNGDFVWGASTAAYTGDQEFNHNSDITEIASVNNKLFVCLKEGSFEHGLILKINNTGGTGHNMFAINSNPQNSYDAFDPVIGYNYYAGDERLDNYRLWVSKITEAGNETFFAFRNGAMLRVTGTAGTGHSMLNVDYDSQNNRFENSFTNSTIYMTGNQQFENDTWASDVDYINGNTFISTYDGKMLQVSGVGGTGNNMFNVTANSGYGFSVASNQYYNYMEGCADFRMSVIGLKTIGSKFFIMLHPGVLICTEGSGTGSNMFKLAYQDENSFKSLCGYNYYVGCEDFTDLCSDGGNRLSNPESSLTTDNRQNAMDVYPNPSNGGISVHVKLVFDAPYRIEIYSSTGQKVKEYALPVYQEVNYFDLSDNGTGIYFVKVTGNDFSLSEKILIK